GRRKRSTISPPPASSSFLDSYSSVTPQRFSFVRVGEENNEYAKVQSPYPRSEESQYFLRREESREEPQYESRAKDRDFPYWTFRLWQKHLASLLQPHERFHRQLF